MIEDDSELRELLEILLTDEGHQVMSVSDGSAALDLVTRGAIRPDLILADYNLPNGMHGLEAVALVRAKLNHQAPVIILTGDISTVGDRRLFERLRDSALKPALALSLHTTDAALRRRLLPRAPDIDPDELVELDEAGGLDTLRPVTPTR